jgi:hypothetical protein
MTISAGNPDLPPPKPAAVGLTKKQKFLRIAIGFIGFYLANGIMTGAWLLAVRLQPSNFPDLTQVVWLFSLLPFLVNVGGLILFAVIKATRWVAFGILMAMAFAFALTVIAGIFFFVSCLFSLGTYKP